MTVLKYKIAKGFTLEELENNVNSIINEYVGVRHYHMNITYYPIQTIKVNNGIDPEEEQIVYYREMILS